MREACIFLFFIFFFGGKKLLQTDVSNSSNQIRAHALTTQHGARLYTCDFSPEGYQVYVSAPQQIGKRSLAGHQVQEFNMQHTTTKQPLNMIRRQECQQQGNTPVSGIGVHHDLYVLNNSRPRLGSISTGQQGQ